MKIKITAFQLFIAIIIVPYGSALLFYMAPEVKHDAWLAMLIYIVPGILLQILYTYLWSKHPQDTIISYLPKVLGKVIGNFLGILYVVFFTYIAARVLRDFSSLINIAVLTKIPMIWISICFLTVVTYATYLGMENLFRSAHIILILWLIFLVLSWIFLFTSPGDLKFHNLKPVLEDGIMTVIGKSWRLLFFPYGESILFTMFYPYVIQSSKIRKAAIFAIIAEGLLITLNLIMFISVLGVDFATNSLFPLLQTLRMMNIGETFDRLDIVTVLFMITAGVMKISFFTYGAMLGTSQILKIKDTKYFALPFSILIFAASILIARNYPQHVKIGLDISIKYFHLPIMIIIPIVTLLVLYVKNLIKSK
ncbi:spore germination protein [Clostridiales bacterium oral taxon 876 str. F0540]|nr:spore germination protein [Clostridiales bacterium oral taxon 876 str. F0540]